MDWSGEQVGLVDTDWGEDQLWDGAFVGNGKSRVGEEQTVDQLRNVFLCKTHENNIFIGQKEGNQKMEAPNCQCFYIKDED